MVRKKIPWKQIAGLLLIMALGVAFGFFVASQAEAIGLKGASTDRLISYLALLLLALYVIFFLQIVIHEAGHLIFGLLSGYRFSSFRAGSLMWVKTGGRLRFRRLSIAGTGGQCLMAPPEKVDGRFPVALFNLGGSILNILSGFIFLGLSFLLREVPWARLLMLMAAVTGFVFGLINGIPFSTRLVNNDGHNALSLRKSPEAGEAFWQMLAINAQMSEGKRLRDMPEDWFVLPDEIGMKNSLVAAQAVIAANRLMDEHRFAEADQLMARLLTMPGAIMGLHRSMLLCDRLYCELIGENRPERRKALESPQLNKFMKAMKKFPSVLRCQYAQALLAEGDAHKAEQINARFEKTAKSYPYPGDVQAERELMAIALDKYEQEDR